MTPQQSRYLGSLGASTRDVIVQLERIQLDALRENGLLRCPFCPLSVDGLDPSCGGCSYTEACHEWLDLHGAAFKALVALERFPLVFREGCKVEK